MLNQKNVVIKVFEPSDIETVHSLVIDTIDKSYSGVYPEEAIDFFKQYHRKNNIYNDCLNGYTIIAEYKGRIVGTGTLLDTNIRRVFINNYFQGQGFGKLIMKKLEEKALEQGKRIVDLSASLVSKRFYDRLGYITQGEKSIDVENNKKLNYYQMVKYLA